MRSTRFPLLLTLLPTFIALMEPPVSAGELRVDDRVTILETPEGGIQPQAAIDDRGVIHLIFFRGEPAGGDLWYTRREPRADRFATPVRVNSQPGSAIAIGTIRGGQIALGRQGRIHVAWNGANGALPKNPIGGSPMLYTRSDGRGQETRAQRTTFEPQRNLMQRTDALDGGGTIAADREGNVYVAWHARTEGSAPGESSRRMWVARSKDDGVTFEPEHPAIERKTGACGCCGTRALADHRGMVYALYRAATNQVERDIYLLTSDDHGAHFQGVSVHPWNVNICPMSSASMAEAGSDVLAAWETQGQVYFCRIDPKSHEPSTPIAPPGGRGNRKHPAVAGNARGETILVWAEGTGWQKGGSLVWQVFDRSGRPIGPEGRIEDGVPVWGLATVVARPDGGFTIIHSPAHVADAAARPRKNVLHALQEAVSDVRNRRRVEDLARQLDGAQDVEKEIDIAQDLFHIDTASARDAVAKFAAQSPLRAFDPTHSVLVIIDGSNGDVHEVLGAVPAREIIGPPGMDPETKRGIEEAIRRAHRFMKFHTYMSYGTPPTIWSGILRLPDGAVDAKDGGGKETVSFILRARDQSKYNRITYTFSGPRAGTAIYDINDPQLRRWQESPWWPKNWR